jgi:hypothetical protein
MIEPVRKRSDIFLGFPKIGPTVPFPLTHYDLDHSGPDFCGLSREGFRLLKGHWHVLLAVNYEDRRKIGSHEIDWRDLPADYLPAELGAG